MYGLIALAVGISLLTVWFFRRKSGKVFPPGPKGLPFLGVAFEKGFARAPHLPISKWTQTFGPIASYKLVGKRLVIISNAKLVRKAFAGENFDGAFNDRFLSFAGDYIHFGSQDVAYARYRDSSHRRHCLHKGMHFYGTGVRHFEQQTLAELERFTEELRETGGKEVDPGHFVKTSICMVVTSLLTGSHNKSEAMETSDLIYNFAETILKIADPMMDITLQVLPWLRFIPGKYRDLYLKSLHFRYKVLDKFYNEQRATYREDHERGLVDVLFRLQREQTANPGNEFRLSDDNIKGIIMNNLAAGVDSSVQMILWTLLILLNNPACMKKIREELDDVVGRDRFPSLSDRSHMSYTQAAVMESFRYVSAAPLLFPHRCLKDTKFEGYDIEADSVVFGNAWFIHHDESIWGDPWTYRPERFLDEDGQLLSPTHKLRESYLPFGVGKRSCPGEALAKSRIFLYTTTLVQTFDLTAPESLTSCDPRSLDGGLVVFCPPFACRFVPRLQLELASSN